MRWRKLQGQRLESLEDGECGHWGWLRLVSVHTRRKVISCGIVFELKVYVTCDLTHEIIGRSKTLNGGQRSCQKVMAPFSLSAQMLLAETAFYLTETMAHRNPFPCAALVFKNRLLGLANFLGGKMGPFFTILIFSYPPFRLV